MPNPLAIGVTLGGLLLDLVVPRPKPRVGCAQGYSVHSERADSRTPQRAAEAYEVAPVAGGTTRG